MLVTDGASPASPKQRKQSAASVGAGVVCVHSTGISFPAGGGACVHVWGMCKGMVVWRIRSAEKYSTLLEVWSAGRKGLEKLTVSHQFLPQAEFHWFYFPV